VGKIKTLYLIRNAKSDWNDIGASDFERGITKKGKKDIETMSSYLMIKNILPDIILSSCALRAQETADIISEKLQYKGKIEYLQELYYTPTSTLLDILYMLDISVNVAFVIGHNPQLTDIANILIDEHISKIPSSAVVAINFDIQNWNELAYQKGKIDFFITPKQFKYYVPKQIRAVLDNV
jgi:phosphohistidine phosphatase